MQKNPRITAVLLWLLYAGGCTNAQPENAEIPAGSRNQAIYARADQQFLKAHLYKPRPGWLDRLEAELAPLILQEVADSTPSSATRDRFGAAILDARGNLVIEHTRPTVYTATSSALLQGRQHVQVSYLWWYRPDTPTGPADDLNAQGIRITLGHDGFPAIIEILAEPSGAKIIVVSEALEKKASEEFGEPLPGRRYSVEAGSEARPEAVVARVISDGPIPFGPFVYLSARTRAVSTIICRCMPAQVAEIAGNETYELLPLDSLAELGLDTAEGESRSLNPLEQCLRLPSSF